MTRRSAAAETRAQLLDAGLRVAERTGLMGLSVNALVEDAGVSKGSFFHHFGDRASYVLALHREFHDRLIEHFLTVHETLPPGAERLRAAGTTYLDACLKHRGVRALLLEARADPLIAEEITKRNASVASLVQPDFEAMGWRHPPEAARLWVGLAAEAALVELRAGRRQPKLRAALDQYLTSHRGGAV